MSTASSYWVCGINPIEREQLILQTKHYFNKNGTLPAVDPLITRALLAGLVVREKVIERLQQRLARISKEATNGG